MGIIEDIIARTLRRMERDLSEIKNIRRIDFVDLFPTSESHRKMLDEEAMREGKIIEETECLFIKQSNSDQIRRPVFFEGKIFRRDEKKLGGGGRF